MNSPEQIAIQLNGQAMDVPDGTSIVQLLELAKIRSQLVAVEVNLEIVPRESHAQHVLAAGDVIEAVTLVGGG
ncbi:sulfur carrier protein ThiS [Aureliella helgolandensis]|uniref:Sulfur carrier protein ThiS n=1 Tax=Aureliella helgolandensis TaxID=2527968 RepID=A0A518G573_9BACT|nr:sulfur carrier protein ThiS [Aureliella helgolandensis]QDV23743.1 Sulfur carrier protein ThiS [Aureliella helgolandensis]